MKNRFHLPWLRLIWALIVYVASLGVLVAQVPDDLGKRTITYENRTMTYQAMHVEVLQFFRKNPVGSVAQRVKELEPYLGGKLTSTRRRELESRLKAISDLRERGVPITQNRKMLGALVAGLRAELERPIIVAAEDPASASGTISPARTESETEPSGENTATTPVSAGESGSSGWLLALSGLLTLLAGGLAYLVYRAREIITRLRTERDTARLEMTSWKEKAKSLQISHEELKEQNTLLRSHVEELETVQAVPRSIEPLVVATEPRRGGVLGLAPELAVVEAPQVLPAPIVEFYLGLPQADGSFADQRSQQFDATHSFYRFRLGKNGEEATFEFADAPATVTTALRQPEACLDPVCEYAEVDYGASHIFTMMPGRARKTSLDSERWELVTKAIVRFSSN